MRGTSEHIYEARAANIPLLHDARQMQNLPVGVTRSYMGVASCRTIWVERDGVLPSLRADSAHARPRLLPFGSDQACQVSHCKTARSLQCQGAWRRQLIRRFCAPTTRFPVDYQNKKDEGPAVPFGKEQPPYRQNSRACILTLSASGPYNSCKRAGASHWEMWCAITVFIVVTRTSIVAHR